MQRIVALLLFIIISVSSTCQVEAITYSTTPTASISDKTAKKKSSVWRYVFIGDSRFVGMSRKVCRSKDVYIVKNSMGLSWFKSQETLFREYDSKRTIFVIGFGANDVYQPQSYVNYVNGLRLKGKVYFCEVMPVRESLSKTYGYSITNNAINKFNLILHKKAKNYKVLKTNKRLQQIGFETFDGVHYTSNTYSKIYGYIKRHVSL